MSGKTLPEPSIALLDGRSLFLDLDGTLFELVDRPERVKADAQTRSLLERLNDRLEGRLAIVSGRSLEQIDAMLGAVAHSVAVSGSHGSEHRWHGVEARPVRPPALGTVAECFSAFAKAHKGIIVEDKSFGVVLHYAARPISPSRRGRWRSSRRGGTTSRCRTAARWWNCACLAATRARHCAG